MPHFHSVPLLAPERTFWQNTPVRHHVCIIDYYRIQNLKNVSAGVLQGGPVGRVSFLSFLRGPEFILIILTPITRCGLKCILKASLSTILINIGKKVMMLVKMTR